MLEFNRAALLTVPAFVVLAAGAALAQSADFGPERSTVAGGLIVVSLPVPSEATGNGTLSVTYAGELAAADEFVDVFVEGTLVGTLNGGGLDCVNDFSEAITIDEAVLAAAAADGNVEIRFQATDTVGRFCGDPFISRDFASSGPFAIYNGLSPGASFAVQGSLAYVDAEATSGEVETSMIANRGALILSNSPDTRRRIERLLNGSAVTREVLSFGGIPLITDSSATLDTDGRRMNFAAGTEWAGAMVWAEGSVAELSDEATEDARFGILHLGMDWMLNTDTMFGIAAQIDSYDERDVASGADFSGRGWMIGPVLTSHLTQDVFLDARLAYGRAENDVERGGTTDDFGSERALAKISVIGHVSYGAYSIFPDAEIAYFTEDSDAYMSTTLGDVDEVRVALGQARLGARMERAFDLSSSRQMMAFMDFDGVHTHRYEGDLSKGSFANEIEGWSAEAEFGIHYVTRGGATVDAGIGIGGLFSSAESHSATVAIRIPLP